MVLSYALTRLERAVAPERGDGDGPDVVAEGACALAEVEDDAGGESVAEAVAEPAQVLGGVGAGRRGRLDFDADHRAARSLEDEVDFPIVVLAELPDRDR